MERTGGDLGRREAAGEPRNNDVPPRTHELLADRLKKLDEDQVLVGLKSGSSLTA